MTLTLPTQPTKPVTELGRQTILLYSAPKLGKSTWCSHAPEAIFFECEPGLNHLEAFKVPTYKWEDFLDACKLVAKGDHNFKTVVIDTIDNAFKMCSEFVCAKHGIEYEGDLGHGKGWALVKNEWHRVLTRLASLPYGLILISHAVDKTIETRTGEFTKTQPSLPDALQQGGAFFDDSQIVWLLTVKSAPVSGGHAMVTIQSADEGPLSYEFPQIGVPV